MNVGKTIFDYFKRRKIQLLFIVTLILLTASLALLPSQILRIIIDDAIVASNLSKLLIFALVYGVSYVLIGVVTFIKNTVMLTVGQNITCDLRKNMMRQIHRMKYRVLINTDSGTLETYFNNDVNSINELFTNGFINILADLCKIVGILITLFIYNYKFGLIVVAILPFLVVFTSFIRQKIMKAQLKTKSLEGNVNEALLENVENIEQIKVNKAENYAAEKYGGILENHYRATQSSNLYDALFPTVMQIIRSIAIVGILLISGWNSSFFGMTAGMIISAISLISDLFLPIETIGMEIQSIQKSFASINRINRLFEFESEPLKVDDIPTDFQICFQNVDFAYDETRVIRDFNLEIQPGEKIALHGPSGTGKSTIMKLAMGLLEPTEGKVTIGGIPAHLISDQTKRHLFSVVYQDPFFSQGTIYEEISLCDKNITRDMVTKALEAVGLDYVNNLNEKFIAKNYSSGELALFNIARVVVRNTKIVFLDEMNSKIDPLTAKNIMAVINRLTHDKIVISINHYGNVLDRARIIEID